MNNLLYKSFLFLSILIVTNNSLAQISGGNGFLIGNYVEVGIAGPGGYEGADLGVGTLPGVHWRSDAGNNLLGFVADPTMSGWVNFDGDFFTPGSPENGWGIEVGSLKASNNGYGGVLEIPGSVTNWSNTNGCIEVDWHGTKNSSGFDLSFDIVYKLNENELFYTTEVTVKNNAAAPISNFYYYRNIDPDNNEVLSFDYSTTNTIVSQPNPPCSKALVSATQNSPWLSYIGLAAIGDNFRVSYGGFSNRDASDLWNGVGFTNTVGSSNLADEAISLSYLIPTLNAGESKSFKFLTILDAAQADNALSSLFYFDYHGSIGSALPECSPVQDTATTCTSMPISIGIQGNALNDFNWAWTPSTGLSTTIGTTVMAQPSVTTTYNVIGTPVNPCYTHTVNQQIVVNVLLGPDAQYVNPGPQCGDFDLNTLIHSDANNTPGAIFNFYSTPPTVAGDPVGIIAPGIISQGDSVWIVYSDTARGCFDAQYVDIQWGTGFTLNIDIVDASCGQSNGSANVTSANGGTSPYTYQWTGGPSTALYDNIGLGFYTVTVTDDTGCSTDSTIQVTQNSTLSAAMAPHLNISCNGLNDGMAYVVVSGGATPYSFLWNDVLAQQNDTAFSLASGSYTVQVTDFIGCMAIDTVLIIEPAPLSITPVLTNLSCFGECNGEIIAAPSGGTPYSSGSSYHYSWNTTPIQTTSTAINLCSGNHTVTVTDSKGCTLDSTFNLIQPIDFTYTTTSQNASCGESDGWAAVLGFAGGTGIYTYNWGVGLPNNDTLFNLSPGPHSVTVSDGNLCDTVITITVGNNAGFTTSMTNIIPTTCKNGNDGEATVVGSNPLATYTYAWTTVPVQNTAIASNLSAGTYYVDVTDQTTGCTATDSVIIIEPDSVTISSISPAVTICSSQSTTITATAIGGSGLGYVYTWDNGLGVGQSHTVTPGAGTTTTYQVTSVDGNGCPSNSSTVTVTVHPNLSIIASADQTICPGTSTTITATPNFGNGGPYSYTWTPNTTISSTTTQSPIVSPIVATTYTVTLSDGCSPTVSDQVIVGLHPLPVPKAESDTLSLCIQPSQPITFYNTTDTTGGMLNPSSVIWNFGDGKTSTNPWDTISHTYTQPGVYAVSMTVSSMPSQGGCTVTQTVIPTINIYELPVADFISSPNPTSMFEPEVQFADQSGSTVATWHWDFAGLDTSNYPNPLYSFPNDSKGDYEVTLMVTDIHGCKDEITKTVLILGEYGIYIPNAFTPDFDHKNDLFGPQGFGIVPENYHFMIFDRWGEKMFDSNVLFEPWDGFYKGTRVPEGVYVWKIFFKDTNKQKHELVGHINIIH